MHVNTSVEICTQHISLHQCRASVFHTDDAMNKWQISCPLWTSPTCLQTQSPHPHTSIHKCTFQITNVLYTHTHHTSTPTWVLHRTFPHYSHHSDTFIYKSTINACLHLANEGPSRVHRDPTSPTHSHSTLWPLCSIAPIPHTLYKSIQSMPRVSFLTVMHIHTHLCQWTHTHPCLPTGTLLASWLQWREALWHYNKQDLETMVLDSHLLETRCVKLSHVPDWSFSAARSP